MPPGRQHSHLLRREPFVTEQMDIHLVWRTGPDIPSRSRAFAWTFLGEAQWLAWRTVVEQLDTKLIYPRVTTILPSESERRSLKMEKRATNPFMRMS
jgi:hypothetical protein